MGKKLSQLSLTLNGMKLMIQPGYYISLVDDCGVCGL